MNQNTSAGDYEWNGIEVFANGSRVSKLRDFKWKASSEMEHLYGAGGEPIGIQQGNSTYTGSLKVLGGELAKMNAKAIEAGGIDVRGVVFTIVGNYKATPTTPAGTRTLVGVRITEYEESMAQGAKMMEVDLPFLFMGFAS